MADATATLNLDATGLKRGAEEAEKAFNRVSAADAKFRKQVSGKRQDGLQDQTRRVKELTNANANLFESERKIKTNLAGLVTEVSTATTGTQALGLAVTRLSETMRIGLAAGIGVAIGSVIADRMYAAADGADALTKRLREIVDLNKQAASSGELLGALKSAGSINEDAEQFANGNLGLNRSLVSPQIEESQRQKDLISKQLIQTLKEDADIENIADKRIVASRLLEQKQNSEIATIRGSNANPGDKDRMVDQIIRKYDALFGRIFQESLMERFAANSKRNSAAFNADLAAKSPFLSPQEAARAQLSRKTQQAREEKDQVEARNTGIDNDVSSQEIATARFNLRAAESAEKNFKFSQFVGPDGRAISTGERSSQMRGNSRRRKNLETSAKKFDETGGLLNIRRGTDGSVAEGTDPITGRRVRPDGTPVGDDPMSIKRTLTPGLMESRLPSAESAASGKSNQTATMESVPKTLTEILQKLNSWDNSAN